MRLTHDAAGEQVWPPPTKLAQSTPCQRMPASVCACGAQRCEACQQGGRRPENVWYHPEQPLPFYVLDIKPQNQEKVAWLAEEIHLH